jgi:hypothetical protein
VIKVLLVGDVLDGEITEIEDGPDHRLMSPRSSSKRRLFISGGPRASGSLKR